MAEKLIVSMLEPVESGQQFESLPLHVTLMPWFEITQESASTLNRYLRVLAKKTDTLELEGEEEVMFGKDEDVRVRKLAASTLRFVHFEILDAISRSGGRCQSPYIAENYNPHVSFVEGESIGQGEIVEVHALQVIEREPKTRVRTVTDIHDFAGRVAA
jgi:2'-5' RNA ligase